jgi:hypothetical protein
VRNDKGPSPAAARSGPISSPTRSDHRTPAIGDDSGRTCTPRGRLRILTEACARIVGAHDGRAALRGHVGEAQAHQSNEITRSPGKGRAFPQSSAVSDNGLPYLRRGKNPHRSAAGLKSEPCATVNARLTRGTQGIGWLASMPRTLKGRTALLLFRCFALMPCGRAPFRLGLLVYRDFVSWGPASEVLVRGEPSQEDRVGRSSNGATLRRRRQTRRRAQEGCVPAWPGGARGRAGTAHGRGGSWSGHSHRARGSAGRLRR